MVYKQQNGQSSTTRQRLFPLSSALIIGLMSTSLTAEVQEKEVYYATLTRGWEVSAEHLLCNTNKRMGSFC